MVADAIARGVLPDEAQMRKVLTDATVRAAEFLSIPQRQLGRAIGVSASTVTRMRQGDYLLDPARKEWELARLMVRLFRSLDSMTGGRDADSRAWLHSGNHALGGVPAELIAETAGLVHVVDYLDASRGRI